MLVRLRRISLGVWFWSRTRGHGALGNVVPSTCTLQYLRDYLRDGSLPEPGTVYGEDCNVFNRSCFKEGESSKAIIFWFKVA
jgi:hypothetical protein